MNFAEELSHIIDALVYVELYGPDAFPAEDCTDLAKEARHILDRFDVVAPRARNQHRQHWLRLARQEIVTGFELFVVDEESGGRHLKDGIDYLRRAIHGKEPRADFVVDQNGIVHESRRRSDAE